jgi:hypothetical protein
VRRGGWAAALALVAAALAAPAAAQTLVVTPGRGANLREKPDVAAAVVARVEAGTALEMVDRAGEWYEVVVPATGETAWIHAGVVRLVAEPAPGPGPPAAAPPAGTAGQAPADVDAPAGAPGERAPGTEASAAEEGAPVAGRDLRSRLTVFAGPGLIAVGPGFSAQRRYPEFAEEARIDSDYDRGTGPALELGLEYEIGPRFGVAVAFNLTGGGASATYAASLPHPLYLDQPRRARGTLETLSYGERAVHADFWYRREQGRIRYAVFAGPSYGSVKAELVERVEYQQTYPFDEVSVTSVPRGTHRGGGFGFNLGAEMDYRWRSRTAAVFRLRYHRLGPDLPEAAGTVDIDGGGLLIGVGLRLSFR